MINTLKAFQLKTVKGDDQKEHLVFFNGSFYENPSYYELLKLRSCLQNSIDNFDGVREFLTNQNELIEKESSFEKPIQNKKETSGFVYILKCNSTKFYKIGITKTDVKKRVDQLKTANANIELFKEYKVENVSIEKELHKLFEMKNVNREWFNLSKKDLEFIDEFIKNSYAI